MHKMTSRFRSLLLAFAVLVAGADYAAACGSGKLLFEDKFQTLDPVWGFDDNSPGRSNGPDGLVYKLDPDKNIVLLNQSGLYDNYEVCAVFATQTPTEADAWVGVAFWATDNDNGYEADIYPAYGTYAVYRYQKGKTLKPISPRSNDVINKGVNVTNEISVVVNGSKAAIVINGKKVIDFSGQPPEDGSLFGFTLGAYKTDTGPSTFTLKDIQLHDVAADHP